MLMIYVDGVYHDSYNDLPGTLITVGSSALSDVRLDWADPRSLTIHLSTNYGHMVTVNDTRGMTHSGNHRARNRNWMIFVGFGEPMTVRGHVLTMMQA
jgi:hypothetical protein